MLKLHPVAASRRGSHPLNHSHSHSFLKALFLNIVIATLCLILLTPAYGRMRADSDSRDVLTRQMAVDDAGDSSSTATPEELSELLRSINEAIEPDTLADSHVNALHDTAVALTDEPDHPRLDSSMMVRTTIYNPEDTMKKPGKRIVRTKVPGDMEYVVDFSAKDSVRLVGTDQAYMYGDSKVSYGSIKLDAANIEMNMGTNTVYAVGQEDSTGTVTGEPVFDDAGTSYESRTMTYNFKTGKGYITDVITQQGDGYLTGGQTKKIDDKTFYIKDGHYTTCDEHDDPHFYFHLTKAKVTPKKNIVTGPAYMVLAGLPLPLAVPFGYFPFSEKYSSGIIVPTFGDDYNKGFYLDRGGYYFAINDYVDLQLLGQIFTKGSWGLNAISRYKKRYKFSGQFNLDYITTIDGDKGLPGYSKSSTFRVLWTHSQDPKANPNLNFSASVNFYTAGYQRDALNALYTPTFTENQTSSSINLSYRPANSKWSFNLGTTISQRNMDSTLSVTLPTLTANLPQVYPFKRKKAMGAERWYEKISINYNGSMRNDLTAKQNQFFKKSLIKDWNNGIKHDARTQATFDIFQYFRLTPSLSMTDYMYFKKIKRSWDPEANREQLDTTYNFYNIFNFNVGLSLSTKIYGFFQPWKKLFGDKVKMIRHVMTPTISVGWHPDFSDPMWGVYDSYSYMNSSGQMVTSKYNMFQNGNMGSPSSGRAGIVSFGLNNNVEMKVRNDNDSTGEKKISLIESLDLSQSYNFAATPGMKRWSDLQASILIRLVKNFNLNINSTWDPYDYVNDQYGRPVAHKTRLQAGKGYARLNSASTSFSYTFNNDTFRKKGSNNSDKGKNKSDASNTFDGSAQSEDDAAAAEEANGENGSKRLRGAHDDDLQLGPDGYMKWECPWSLSFNYSVSYNGNGEWDPEAEKYKGNIRQNLSFSGNIRPTKNWNFSMSGSYNFDLHKINYMTCNISRDLHCFTLTCSFVPLGPYKSYNLHIAVKSSLLSDLKYDKRSSSGDGLRWY